MTSFSSSSRRWAAIASPLLLGALLFGCPTSPPTGGTDSGTPPDEDAGVAMDGGGVEVDAGGSGAECGGITGLPCPTGEYCYIVEGCGFDDGTGTCRPIPTEGCPEVYDPVCGCDGMTYGNDCRAASAGQSVLHVGECEGLPPSCAPMDVAGVGDCRAILGHYWDGRSCMVLTGCECAGADCRALYGSAADCEAAHLGCPSPGACDPMDAVPEGDCDLALGIVWNGRECLSISGCSCVGSECGSLFRDMASCEAAYSDCGGGPTTCGLPGTPGCDADSYCAFTMCGRDGNPGTCQPTPTACPDIFDPVCGCDGMTYGNGCEAALAGISVEHPGECAPTGATCGVRGAPPCGRLEYCDYSRMDCGASDAGGTCQPRPEVCPDVIAPVCGCDGMTYNNECEAAAAGQDIVSMGPCPRPGV